MDPEAPTGVERRGTRRWLRWLAAAIFLLPLAAFGLSNLALGSKWGRDWIAARIHARTTLDTTIGGASWSPWNGVTFRDIRLEQPAPLRAAIAAPLVRISRLRVVPVWQAALKGHPDIRSLTLDSPEIVLPLEIISHFAPPPTIPPAAAPQPPPATAAVQQPSPTPENLPSAPPQPPSIPTPAPPPPTTAAIPSPAPAPAQPSPAPSQPAPPPTDLPPAESRSTDFIHLNNASFSLVLGGHPTPILETSGIEGSIPVAGKAAESSLLVSFVRFLGNDTIRDLRLPLQWSSPLITIPSTDTTISGLQSKIAAQFGMLSGLPAAFEISSPEQPGVPLALPGNHQFKPVSLAAIARCQGLLLSPASWQADFIASTANSVTTSPGHETRFDQGRIVTHLRGGTLSCVDARLTGDEISLLGNATVLSNGKAAGVLRIIAPPETTVSIVRQLFPGVTSPPAFSRMSTPQRSALDIEASGTLGNLDIRLGKNGPLVGQPAPPASATPQ